MQVSGENIVILIIIFSIVEKKTQQLAVVGVSINRSQE